MLHSIRLYNRKKKQYIGLNINKKDRLASLKFNYIRGYSIEKASEPIFRGFSQHNLPLYRYIFPGGVSIIFLSRLNSRKLLENEHLFG